MRASIEIGKRPIGESFPTYIVAELSANHRGDFGRAVELVRAAKEAGADAVKIQTFTADTLTIRSRRKIFRVSGETPWDGRSLYDLYQEAAMPWDWQPRLKTVAEDLGLDLFSSAFDPTAVEFLERMGVPAHKVASFELVDLPLIEAMARTGKPLVLSTGLASLGEIEEAVDCARRAGAKEIALLRCTSAYPAPPQEMNLRSIPHLIKTFGAPTGLSDHTLGHAVALAAVALGACIVEKHFTLSRDEPGPDSAFSMEPGEFKEMVAGIRVVEKALGTISYAPGAREVKNRVLRRSLFVVKEMQAREKFTRENVRSIRPGHGLHPRHLGDLIGRRATRNIARGTPLRWDLVGPSAGDRNEPA